MKKKLRNRCFAVKFCELFKNTYFAEYLRTTGFEKSVLGSLFNKVASLTVRKPVEVLERTSITDISL